MIDSISTHLFLHVMQYNGCCFMFYATAQNTMYQNIHTSTMIFVVFNNKNPQNTKMIRRHGDQKETTEIKRKIK